MALSPKNLEARLEALHEQFEGDPTSGAFFPFASLLWQKGEADQAITVLTDGLSSHPSYLAPRVLLAEIYLAKDRIEEAADELEKVVEKAPWNLVAQKLLMESCQKRGDEAGVRRAQVAIGMFDPSDDSAVSLLEESIGPSAGEEVTPLPPDIPEDEAPLDEALEPVATPSLAELYVSQGHLQKAANVYRQLLEAEPNNQAHTEKLSELEQQINALTEDTVEQSPVESIEETISAPEPSASEEAVEELSEELLASVQGEEFLEIPEEEIPAIPDEPAPPVQPATTSQASNSDEFVDDVEALFREEEEEPLASYDVSEDLIEEALEVDEPEVAQVEVEEEADQDAEIVEQTIEELVGGAEPDEDSPSDDLMDGALEDVEDLFGGDENSTLEKKEEPADSLEDGDLGVDIPDIGEDSLEDSIEEAVAEATGEIDLEDMIEAPSEEETADDEDGSLSLLEMDTSNGDETFPEAIFEEPPIDLEDEAETTLPEAILEDESQDVHLPEEMIQEELTEVEELAELIPESISASSLAEDEAVMSDAEEGEDTPEKPNGTLDFVEELTIEEGSDSPGELVGGQVLDFTEETEPETTGSVSVVREIVELYIQEGKFQQALDICHKVEKVGERSAWLESQIPYLEEKAREDDLAYLPSALEDDKKATPSSAVSSSQVILALEGWLQTIQRRRTDPSAEQNGEKADGSV